MVEGVLDLVLRGGRIVRSGRRQAEDDVVNHPDFFFVIGAFGFDDFVNFGGVFGRFASGVEVELALFFGEEFALESETLLVEADEVEAMGDARERVHGGGSARMIGEVVTGVGEFDFDVLNEFVCICGSHVIEF